jgi:hypothetical protein
MVVPSRRRNTWGDKSVPRRHASVCEVEDVVFFPASDDEPGHAFDGVVGWPTLWHVLASVSEPTGDLRGSIEVKMLGRIADVPTNSQLDGVFHALLPTPPGSPVGVDTAIRLLTADAEADNASLLANGVDTDPVMRFGEDVPPMFTFRDPDSNTLYVVES